jgi:DNA-binding protein
MAKPTKQQVAQAKVRAGGNNPVNLTNAELKKLANGVVTAVSIVAPGAAIRDAVLLAKAIKAGKLTKDTIRAVEISKLQKAAQEKPYVRNYRGTQAKNADVTLTRGSSKVTPPAGTKAKIARVIEPQAPKTVAARESRSGARIKSVDEAIKENIRNRKGKLVRSTAAAVAGSTNLKPKKK